MKYKLIIIMTIFSIISNIPAFAESITDKFERASQLYQKGDYQGSVLLYKEFLKKGYESPEIYYNLGNAYYRLGNIPEAILNYERAKRLSPEDEDINFNLNVANLKIIDKIEPVPQVFFIEWFNNIRELLSSDGWAVFVIILVWLGFIALSSFFFFWSPLLRKIFFFSTIISLVLAVVFLIFAQQNYSAEQSKNQAIIFSPSIYVKSSPDEGGTDLFILHEGTKVEILDEVGNWEKIKLINGNIGWLPRNSIEII